MRQTRQNRTSDPQGPQVRAFHIDGKCRQCRAETLKKLTSEMRGCVWRSSALCDVNRSAEHVFSRILQPTLL
jgi:hypothetical protein